MVEQHLTRPTFSYGIWTAVKWLKFPKLTWIFFFFFFKKAVFTAVSIRPPQPAAALLILAALHPSCMSGQEALCRLAILSQPAGSNCGHFLMTNTRARAHKSGDGGWSWAELQLGLPPSRVTIGAGADGPAAVCASPKPQNSTIFNATAPADRHARGRKLHLPVGLSKSSAERPVLLCIGTAVQTSFKTVAVSSFLVYSHT